MISTAVSLRSWRSCSTAWRPLKMPSRAFAISSRAASSPPRPCASQKGGPRTSPTAGRPHGPPASGCETTHTGEPLRSSGVRLLGIPPEQFRHVLLLLCSLLKWWERGNRKDRLGGRWVESEYGRSVQQARKYMRVARHKDELNQPRGVDLSLSAARMASKGFRPRP